MTNEILHECPACYGTGEREDVTDLDAWKEDYVPKTLTIKLEKCTLCDGTKWVSAPTRARHPAELGNGIVEYSKPYFGYALKETRKLIDHVNGIGYHLILKNGVTYILREWLLEK